MSIEYRGDGKFRFRVRKDGIYYTQNYFYEKKLTDKDVEVKNWSKEIKDAHKTFEVNIMQGDIGTGENMKFSHLAQLVLDEYVRPTLRPASVLQYISITNNHLLIFFGEMKIQSIKTIHVQKFVNELLAKGLKLTTVKTIYKEFIKIMNKAVEWDLIKEAKYNIKFPTQSKSNYAELLSDKDIEKLMRSIANEEDITLKTIYSIALFTGMRQAEILALQITDIDLKNNKIKVDKQYGKVYNEENKVERNITDTKTSNSVRTVYAPTFVCEIIKQYISAIKVLPQSGLLFFNINTQKPYSREWITTRFRSMLLLNNIPKIKFHDMRHLYATIALHNGVNIVTVAKTMGDTIDTVIKNYTHGIDNIQQSSAASFDKYSKIL